MLANAVKRSEALGKIAFQIFSKIRDKVEISQSFLGIVVQIHGGCGDYDAILPYARLYFQTAELKVEHCLIIGGSSLLLPAKDLGDIMFALFRLNTFHALQYLATSLHPFSFRK